MTKKRSLKNTLKSIAGGRRISFFDLDMYSPFNRGPNREKTDHALESANTLFTRVSELAGHYGTQDLPIIEAESYREKSNGACDELKTLLDDYGSDKANKHNYHLLLACILSDRESIKSVLEIGLGTNNPDVSSNMTKHGKPGASVRAFRDFLPNADIFGADFDKRILFSEERIKTFFVDQTKPETLAKLKGQLPTGFDLIIDDGLHSPLANVNSVRFGLELLSKGGWMIVEDVNPATLDIWQIVARLVATEFETTIVQCTHNPVIAFQRKA